jgi:predicted nucleotidyltransferase component of viral defense system
MDFFEEVRKLTIKALFSDDVLFNQLVLKGGNAVTLVYGLGMRASFDLDFSLKGDFPDPEDAKNRAFRALESRFSSAGYAVFDTEFVAKPVLHGPDERPWWGGYELSFKLLKTSDYERLRTQPAKMQREAVTIGPNQKRKLKVDISKNEYVEGKIDQDLDHVTIRVYTPSMVAAEKIRALCQQMPEYALRGNRRGRARDFYDIFLAVTRGRVDLQSADSRILITEMFSVKRVPVQLLGRLESQREFHRPDWPSVIAAVPDRLEEFDFYFDFVLEQVRGLETLWNV